MASEQAMEAAQKIWDLDDEVSGKEYFNGMATIIDAAIQAERDKVLHHLRQFDEDTNEWTLLKGVIADIEAGKHLK